MLFEWMADPAAWAGLATLIVLEVVLGIDNLVFIAILADKLPEHQRDRARLIGLSLALVMRLALLASIAWIVTLTQPLFSILGFAFSGRSLILIFGGLFLLFKGTMELHERLEGHSAGKGGKVAHAVFWQVLVQIVLLDAVFSLDSVITAVGMVDHLSVMMIAVIVAIGVMMLSSGPLMRFVSSHPTVVILCLGFLLMIGFSLIVEGFGFHIPKGYLYAAITFSIIIEAFNQIGHRNRALILTSGDLRDRTADAILRLLGSPQAETTLGGTGDVLAEKTREERVFAPEEKDMIQGVLTLAERPVKSIMTPRTSIDFLDLDDAPALLRQKILDGAHTRFPIARGELDNFLGVALAKDMLRDILEEGEINPERSLRQPLVIHESTNVLGLMAKLRKSPLQMAIVMDEYGSVEGIATPIDVLEAIAGEFPDEDEDAMTLEQREDGVWVADGGIDIRRASTHIGADLVDDSDRYSTLAGYLLWHLGDLPREGQSVVIGPLAFEVLSMKGRHINKVLIRRQD